MSELRWLPGMSVGVKEFDDDHRRVIDILSDLHAALSRGETGRASELAAQLLALARDHIGREEEFLRRIGFPGVPTVIGAQKESLGRIALLAETMRDDAPSAHAQVTAMQLAFIDYLMQADINYKSYVEANGLADC